ncbi:MAG: hypothetical protein J3K34DRAFT_6343 [Monoraphidium minutum]|nr:MAG: hypothetical protein J3K34DRAFT_6343 [Monoraphidium minutum]
MFAMPLSTARWLDSKLGWSAFPCPTASALENPNIAAYFAAALLATMYTHDGRLRGEKFAVAAFAAGPGAAAAALRRGGGGGGGDDCGGGDQEDDGWGCEGEEGRCVGGAEEEVAALWARYQRAKGLVEELAAALALRRRAEAARPRAPRPELCGDGGGGGVLGGGVVMHLVHQGETLGKIAAVAGTSVAELLAANPDLPGEAALQPNDLIALPVAAVLPRLHALRPGDSLRAVARRYGVTLGRLLARNPELCDPRSLRPGWVVAIPGLRGGLGLRWGRSSDPSHAPLAF